MPQLHLSLHKFQGSIEDPTETTYTVDARRFNYPTGDISADALGDWVRENEAERFDRLYIDVFHWVFTHAAETLSIHVVCQSGRTRSLGVLHALRQKLYRDVEHEIVVHLNEENVSVHTVTEPIPSAGQKRKAEEDDDSRPLKKDSRQVTLFGTVATRKGPRQRKITASERVSTRSQPVLHSPYFIQPVAPVTDPDFHTVDVEAARELLRENEALPFGWLNLDARLATWPLPAAEAYYAAEQTRQTWTQIDQPHTELEQYSKDYTKVRSKALIHASMIHLPCGGSPNYMDFQEEIALRAGLNPELLGVFKKPKTAEEKAIEDANFAEGHAAEEAMRDEWRDKWGLITTKTGIWYNPDLPESSGSPDGIVECEPKAVIEFKWNTDRKKDRRAENQSAYVMQAHYYMRATCMPHAFISVANVDKQRLYYVPFQEAAWKEVVRCTEHFRRLIKATKAKKGPVTYLNRHGLECEPAIVPTQIRFQSWEVLDWTDYPHLTGMRLDRRAFLL